MKKQELFDNLLKANLEIVRLKGEIGNVLHMMEPAFDSGVDDCFCQDQPEDYDNPANHDHHCPFYFQAYLRALADGAELPQ
jgi:hypothetical protein